MSPPQLATRKLGKNGPQVPALGLGLMGFSVFYGPVASVEERLKFLDKAYELGETYWDTADMYGDSEEVIGEWFKRTGKRDEIFLASKFANVITETSWTVDISPEAAVRSINKSLKRLQTDHIDLYYVHRVDGKTPIEKTMEVLVQLQKEGKIKYIGLSEISSRTLRRAEKIAHIDAIQVEYSPFALDIESPEINLLKTARELGTAVVAYSPLGRGFLTGSIKSPDDFAENDFRRRAPRFSKENFPLNLKIIDTLGEIAKKKGITTGQLTLAWLLAQGDDVFPIPGTTKVKNLEENIGALQVRLTPEELQEVRALLDKVEVKGFRYQENDGQLLYGDTPELE